MLISGEIDRDVGLYKRKKLSYDSVMDGFFSSSGLHAGIGRGL